MIAQAKSTTSLIHLQAHLPADFRPPRRDWQLSRILQADLPARWNEPPSASKCWSVSDLHDPDYHAVELAFASTGDKRLLRVSMIPRPDSSAIPRQWLGEFVADDVAPFTLAPVGNAGGPLIVSYVPADAQVCDGCGGWYSPSEHCTGNQCQ